MPHSIRPAYVSALSRASRLFPELPAEVSKGFLAPLIHDIGWPFNSVEECLNGTDWHRIMYPFTLQQFAQLRWRREALLFDKRLLHPISKNDFRLVIRNLREDVWAAVGRDSEPSRKSFAYHRSRVLSTHDFCAPVTLAATPVGFKVLDGNHRVAALLTSGLSQTVPLDAWVGFSSNEA